MNIWYNIKNFFRFYSSNIRTIKVIQYDGVEYSYDIDKSEIQNEINSLKPLVKLIKVL